MIKKCVTEVASQRASFYGFTRVRNERSNTFVQHHYHKPNSQWYIEKTFFDPSQFPTKITIMFDFPQLSTDDSHKFPKFLTKKTPGFLMKSDS